MCLLWTGEFFGQGWMKNDQKWEDTLHHENDKTLQWCKCSVWKKLVLVKCKVVAVCICCCIVSNEHNEHNVDIPLSLLKISNLIATEILQSEDVNVRVAVMEKWVAVADICRCLHNYNAVLEITLIPQSQLHLRLKKTCSKCPNRWGTTWIKPPKNVMNRLWS